MEIKMPKLDVTMTEGTFLGWLVPNGATVEEGEDLYTVGTDKVSADIPSPAAGVLEYGPVEEDETYPVGTVLGILHT
ncbi:biotin-requiring enzyme family protein [Mycolicibacterium hassiacum DSM 44199]|jgi:pyruvate/2-oxoglutarate dehydrogenase complex dihydrolipoamide acyltransferase (E2) component|uniref:Biotin-requiring enzyme family protein n=1 Tax=Mycolicibacterium hassiacum (strain DSM 44199 / CIP 105218 / JCM 12690 / 3849) TaxID=1122247 RepID=K5B944_MYCHD|nr:biotin/lipoyl-containing protein [Mycolicibacterium hassiacum]EKF24803.1 biotin-requiring enzyme family protein [Mycolicibacterium hassiacum DSM 44199]MBX5488824.1 biotin-requiring enzyme family protein [Mycolicibacterium hassiacum]MDA4087059.1 dihydrolipoamide acyltransferase [Mycolicibacterium hassiacum DSM 44199]